MTLSARTVRALATVVAIALLGGGGAGQTKPRNPSKSTKGGAKSPKDAYPSFESRRSDWLQRKQAAADAGMRGPDPLTQYLVAEVLVTGVYDTETGHGVFLLARPSGNTFFATPGAALYNGRLIEIRPAASGFVEDFQIVFAERGSKGGPEKQVVRRVERAPDRGAS